MKSYALASPLRIACLVILLFGVISQSTLALEKVHVVRRGDSLASIARQYDVSISRLAAHNGIDHSDYIFVGQRMLVPGSTEQVVQPLGIYTVRVGDDLHQIARDHDIPLEKLLSYNGLASPNNIWVGQPILVPVTVNPGGARQNHRVRTGETLFSIAQHYGVQLETLAFYNQLTDAGTLQTGQTLTIPRVTSPTREIRDSGRAPVQLAQTRHTVTLGESLSFIAQSYNVPISNLIQVNELSHDSLIWIGQSLRLPLHADGTEPVLNLPQPPAPLDTPLPEHEPEVPSLTPVEESAEPGFIHIVQPGETLAILAKRFSTTVSKISNANRLLSRDLIRIGQRLRIPAKQPSDTGYQGSRWIEVDLSDQTVTAWEGDEIYLHALISSGRPGYETPTGHFKIWHMNPQQTMSGPGYRLPGVKFNMYFIGNYALHGTYWHNNFGQTMSRGCVNMTEADAEKLYRFVSLGMEVWVHH